MKSRTRFALTLAFAAMVASTVSSGVTATKTKTITRKYSLDYVAPSTPGLYNLYESPAGWVGGVQFEAGTYKGIPVKISIEDDTGTDVYYSACQINGPNENLCEAPGNTNDITTDGCGTGRLSGFKKGNVDIWVPVIEPLVAIDSCSGIATQGTVTMTTVEVVRR